MSKCEQIIFDKNTIGYRQENLKKVKFRLIHFGALDIEKNDIYFVGVFFSRSQYL